MFIFIYVIFFIQNVRNGECIENTIIYNENEKIRIETIKGIEKQLKIIMYQDSIEAKRKLDSILINSDFSIENLRLALKNEGIKYPHIVLKQAIVETGWFKSKAFKEANNLFGMHRATKRPNTQSFYIYADPSPKTGKHRKVAGYDNWYESVRDYKLYQEYIEKSRNNEITKYTDYYKWLKQVGYCETSSYTNLLKSVVI